MSSCKVSVTSVLKKSKLFFGGKNLKYETSQRAILWELRYSMQS